MKRIILFALFIAVIMGQNLPWKKIDDRQVSAIAISPSGGFYLVMFSDGLYRSFDRGQTWTKISAPYSSVKKIHCEGDSTVILHALGGLAISRNCGNTWRTSVIPNEVLSDLFVDRNGYLHVCTYNGIYARSTDMGLHWETHPTGKTYISHIAVLDNGRVFASKTDTLIRSTDGGTTWSAVPCIFGGVINALEVDRNSVLYVASTPQITVSRDSGRTWQMSLSLNSYDDLFLLSNRDSAVYTTREGIRKTVDGGINWQYVGNARPKYWAVNHDEILYAIYSGVYLASPHIQLVPAVTSFPLQKGNKYQWLWTTDYTDFPNMFSYSLTSDQILVDSLINNKRYYLYGSWLRYSAQENKVYCLVGNDEKVFLDFTSMPGGYYTMYDAYRGATVSARTECVEQIVFGVSKTVYYIFQYISNGSFSNSYHYYFADSIGLFKVRTGSSPHDIIQTRDLIIAKLIDGQGNINWLTRHLKPQILHSPVTQISSGSLSLPIKINHQYSGITSTPSNSLNFLDSARIEQFYQNGPKTISAPPYHIQVNPHLTSNDYSVTLPLNEVVLAQGFKYYYRIIAKDRGLLPEYSTAPDTGFYECSYNPNLADSESRPTKHILGNAYPNPFNPATTIRYEIPKAARVTLSVYNLLGARIAVLVNEEQAPDAYEVKFDGSALPSGTYFYELRVNEFRDVRKMLLVK